MEEYEDELLEFFSRESDNVKDKLCSKRTGKPLPFAACAHGPSHTQESAHTPPVDAPQLASHALGLESALSALYLSAFRICVSIALDRGERAAGGHLSFVNTFFEEWWWVSVWLGVFSWKGYVWESGVPFKPLRAVCRSL